MVEDVQAILGTLSPTPTEEEPKNFARLFDKDARAYFNGALSVGHEAIQVLETLTAPLNYWKSLGGRVTAAMDNRILIVGKELDQVRDVTLSKESGLS